MMSLDIATVVLLPACAFFLVRVVRHQDAQDQRLNNHAQRLTALDGGVDNA